MNLATNLSKRLFPRLNEKKVCFITPPSAFTAYTGTAINAATQVYPYLSYQYLSAWLKKLQLGFQTSALDMGAEYYPWCSLASYLLRERPKYLGLSFTTPLFYEAKLIGCIAKYYLGPELMIVHGSIHATALPEESLTETMCDVVVVGEGEVTFGEICQGNSLQKIAGIVYRADSERKLALSGPQIIRRLSGGEPGYDVQKEAVWSGPAEIKRTPPRGFIKNAVNKSLDDLPFPDMELFDIWQYKNPRVVAKGYPMQQVETSRGCPYTCNFCSAEDTYRMFSPDYTVEMFHYMIKYHGVQELRIVDDQFLTHVRRGKAIAEKMLQRGIVIPWNMANGVRADRVDAEFLNLAKRTGCYQTGAGFEAGDQDSLNSIQKSLDIEKSYECVRMIKEAGIEIVGFFMIGTPADTEETMQKTIDFAKKMMLDYAKCTVCIPFPDTRLYAQYKRAGLIVSEKWDDYNIHKAIGVYRHPHLAKETITEFYWKFYKEVLYGNREYLEWMIPKSFADGSVIWKAQTAFKLVTATAIPDDPRRYRVTTAT